MRQEFSWYSLEKEAEIEIFANGISADIALVDFRVPKCGRGRGRSAGITLPFSVAIIARLGKTVHTSRASA
jgi:hypothetical protein